MRPHSLAVAITACWVRPAADAGLMTPTGTPPRPPAEARIGQYDLYRPARFSGATSVTALEATRGRGRNDYLSTGSPNESSDKAGPGSSSRRELFSMSSGHKSRVAIIVRHDGKLATPRTV